MNLYIDDFRIRGKAGDYSVARANIHNRTSDIYYADMQYFGRLSQALRYVRECMIADRQPCDVGALLAAIRESTDRIIEVTRRYDECRKKN